jgi:hypothetical protein
VVEERAHRSPHDAGVGTLPRRVRSYLGLTTQDRPLPRPPRLRVEPVRRTWLGAFWHARISVRAGIPLDDYLRSRLARYLAGLPVAHARLPLRVDVDDGQIVVAPGAPERSVPAAAASADAWLAPLVAAEGPAIRQEVAEHEIRLALLEGEIDAARRRHDDLSARLAADIANGIVAAPPSVEATAEQMGRPVLRSSGPSTALFAFTGAALAAETWQIAVPLLAAAGLDARELAAEASRRPAEVTFISIFALGVAAGLFALAHAGLQAAASLVRGEDDARRRRWLALGAAGSAAVSVLIAGAMAALAPAGGAPPARMAYALLLVAVPLGAALVLRAARREADARAAGLDAALAWDRSRAAALSDRARRLEELSWSEGAQRELEGQRELTRANLRRISARAVAAARIEVEAERQEREALARVSHGLVAALELDRYEFVRQATARGAPELVSRRRKVEGRPALVEAQPGARQVEASRAAM